MFLFNLQVFAQSKEGFWYIQSQNGKFLNVHNNSNESSAAIILEEKPLTLWKIRKTDARDGYYHIEVQHNGLYLTIPLGKDEYKDNAKVLQKGKISSESVGLDNQKWKIERYHGKYLYISNKKNSKRLSFKKEDIYEDESDFTVVQLDSEKKKNNQLWILVTPPKTESDPKKTVEKPVEIPIGINDVIGTTKERSNIWAVFVGISDYENAELKLKFAVNDAYEMYAHYRSPEGGAISDKQIHKITDREATRANILQALENINQKAGENDVLLFYFSGHGLKGAYIPADHWTNNPSLLYQKEVLSIFDKSKAKYRIIISDVCKAEWGNNLSAKSKGEKPANAKKDLNELVKKFEEQVQQIPKQNTTTVLLASCKEDEDSTEYPEFQKGLFTHYLIDGLKNCHADSDWDKDGIITIEELASYVRDKVSDHSNGNQNPIIQTSTKEAFVDLTMPLGVCR